MDFADHFSAVAARYAAYRPHYPPALPDALAALCDRRELAWDAGCGNGQLSVALGDRFAHVIATDPSRAQIDAATGHAHVEYRCEPAEASTLADGSADLVVAAQAAHWFDWPRYVAEVERVARPGALAALVSYGIVDLDGEVGGIVARYYADVSPYWPPQRHHVDEGYRELVWPWPAMDPPAIAMVEMWTRDELTGYVATWSATSALVRATGSGRYDELCAELSRTWPGDDRRAVRWPLTIRVAKIGHAAPPLHPRS
jgi:SAM-dependent methyltransferase